MKQILSVPKLAMTIVGVSKKNGIYMKNKIKKLILK